MHAVGLATYAACVALLFFGTLYRAPVAVAAVFCMFGLDQLGQTSHPWLLQHQTFTNYLVGGLLLIALLRKRMSVAELLRACPKQTWLVLSLYLYAFLSILWTRMPEIAWEQWLSTGPYIVTVALASPLLITDADDMRLALRWTVFVGLLLAVVILVFGQWGIRGLVVDPTSIYETNPLALASFAGVVAAAVLFVGSGGKGWLEWLLRLAGAVVCLLLIVRSGSRGQLIAIIASLAIMLPMRFQLSSVRGLIPAVLACVAVAVALDIGASLYVVNDEARWSGEQAAADVTGRFAMIVSLLGEWSRSPISILFGLGTSASWDAQLVGIYLHNLPAEVLGEEGLVGFVLLLLIVTSATASFLRARRFSRQRPQEAGTLAAIGAAAIFCFVLSLKQGSLLGNYSVFMAILLTVRTAVAIGAHSQREIVLNSEPAGNPPRHFANLLR